MKFIGFPFLESEHRRLVHHDKTDVNNINHGNLKIIGLTQNCLIRDKWKGEVSINFIISPGSNQKGEDEKNVWNS